MVNAWIPRAVIAILLSACAVGCTPKVVVTPHPGPDTKGIRFYRPKPYLKVVPAVVQVGKDSTEVEPSLVTISLEYLPDFSEEYAIDVRSGLGIAEVSLKLEDGWNLTEISQSLDSQTDENISAAGDLIKAISGVIPTSQNGDGKATPFTVRATDVPLGYYEAVLGCGSDGRKRLYGFRYLGFLPYETCPTSLRGSGVGYCGDPTMPLYGLTFEGGRMVFRPLIEMAVPKEDAAPISESQEDVTATSRLSTQSRNIAETLQAETLQAPAEPSVTRTETLRQIAASLEVQLLTSLRGSFPETTKVEIRLQDGEPMDIQVTNTNPSTHQAVENSIQAFIEEVSPGLSNYNVTIGRD